MTVSEEPLILLTGATSFVGFAVLLAGSLAGWLAVGVVSLVTWQQAESRVVLTM